MHILTALGVVTVFSLVILMVWYGTDDDQDGYLHYDGDGYNIY
jgi:hypothetical protein